MTLPKISIVTATLNAEKYLVYFFECLNKQTYPKDRIEIIAADGGSTDGTRKLVQKNHGIIVENPYVLAEPGATLGMKKATGDLICVLAADNYFEKKDDLAKIVKIFQNKEIYAAFPKHIYKSTDSIFTKYLNAFTDPFNHFVYGDAANFRTYKYVYKSIFHNGVYDIYDFSSAEIRPIIALAQGFTFRREFLKYRTDQYDDVTPVYKMIDSGKKMAYVHSVSVYHPTVRNMEHFIRKQRWTIKNALEKKSFGINLRQKTLTTWQKFKMYFFPIYAFSILLPCINTLRGYLRDREPMWFFHPIISCMSATAIMYEFLALKFGFNKKVSKL